MRSEAGSSTGVSPVSGVRVQHRTRGRVRFFLILMVSSLRPDYDRSVREVCVRQDTSANTNTEMRNRPARASSVHCDCTTVYVEAYGSVITTKSEQSVGRDRGSGRQVSMC